MAGKGSGGFSVGEILVALFIVSLAALGIIVAMTKIAVSQHQSSHQTVAYLVAEQVLQRARTTGPPEWGIPAALEDRKQTMIVGQEAASEDFFYELTAAPLPEPTGSDALYPSGADMGDLYLVEVTAWWGSDETGPDGRVGQGARRVRVGRVVYVER